MQLAPHARPTGGKSDGRWGTPFFRLVPLPAKPLAPPPSAPQVQRPGDHVCHRGVIQPPGTAPGRRRLHRIWVGVVALAVAGSSLVIGVSVSRSGSRAPREPVGPPSGVVSWLNHPAPDYHPPPPPRPAYPTGPDCGPSALKLVGTRGGAAAGNGVVRISFRNVSPGACEVRGYPALEAVGRDGAVSSLRARRRSFFGNPGPRAAAGPGEVIAVNVSGSDMCTRRPAFARLRLVL